jgi:hypothetical protein
MLTSLRIQPREDLLDCPEVIRRVSGRGESGGSAHVVPIRAGGDDHSPFFGFVAETVTQSSPLILGNYGALPTAVPVSAGPRIPFACRPAVQDGEAEMNVIDVRGDRRFSGHGPMRRRARVDRVELSKQAGITWVEQIRFLARRAIENLRQHVGQGALKD